MSPALLLVLACVRGDAVPLAEGAPVWVEARQVPAGQAVRVHVPPGTTLPEVEGLSAREVATDNGASVWELTGSDGSYVVDVPAGATGTTRLFVDIGVTGPTGGPMEDLVGVAPPPPPVWPKVLAATVALGALGGAAVYAWRRFRPIPPPPPPEPADRVARRAWAALRARDDLDAGVLAAELSAVYRRYLEARHTWPATSRTSREILDALAGDLPAMQLERARRLLNAMDIVRFSDRSTHDGFFASLDTDFEALLSVGPGVTRA